MKTIEEAAREHVKNKQLFTVSEKSFKAGVEFAKRWIPVEEELPPYYETVNVKFIEIINNKKLENITSAWRANSTGDKEIWTINGTSIILTKKIIAWRPIELK